MRTLIKLAWRNIWRNKRRSMISIASVLFAVLFAISAESLERGTYELQIENMVMFSTGYIQIQDVLYQEEPSMDNMMLYDASVTEAIASLGEEISYTVPRIQGFALAATDHKTRGVMLMGIDPVLEHRFNALSDQVIRGDYLSGDDNAVLLSEGLAKILNLDVGDTLIAIGQGFQGVNASGMYPVKGIVKLALQEMNNNTAYLPLSSAQWFFGADDRVTSVIVMPRQPKNSDRVAAALQQKLDPEWYNTLTWREMLSDFLRMMQLDTAGNKVIIMILYIVIGFGLFGTILTMMMERMREFAMMIAIGMKRWQLALVCLLESIFLSFVGVVAGMLITFPIVYYFNINPIPLKGEMADMMADYGFSAVIPTSVAPTIFISQAVIIFFIALLIGLYPVVKTMKMDVVQHAK